MTEQQMQAALAMIEARIAAAEQHGLKATAQCWRDYRTILAARFAAETEKVRCSIRD